MSKQAVTAFLEQATKDDALRHDAWIAQVTALVQVAAKHGHPFTTQEYADVVTHLDRQGSEELDDSQLAEVAGGFNPQPEPPAWWSRIRNVMATPYMP